MPNGATTAAATSTASSSSGTTLRRPIQIVKKRSGPLEDALDQLHEGKCCSGGSTTTNATVGGASLSAVGAWQLPSPIVPSSTVTRMVESRLQSSTQRRRPTIKEKEKKRERWLLTRKTWKYMTDAGRKLIPDGAQNPKEDIPEIEAHFQQVCENEPRFILWRRKSSYPGAMRNSRNRLKHLLHHSSHRQRMEETQRQEEAQNADQIIDLLQSYLKLDEACKTTTLLGSKTVRPDQTASPSAQRPSSGNIIATKSAHSGSGSRSLRGHGFLVPEPTKGLQQLSEIDQLLHRLSLLSHSTHIGTIPTITLPERITPTILEDKALLKQLYNLLKKQQLHRILSKHSTTPADAVEAARSNLKHSTSLSSLTQFGHSGARSPKQQYNIPVAVTKSKEQVKLVSPMTTTTTGSRNDNVTAPRKPLHHVTTKTDTSAKALAQTPRQRKPPSSLDLAGLNRSSGNNSSGTRSRIKQPQVEPKQYNSCATQTNFVPLHDIKRFAEEYNERKREEASLNASATGTPGGTDDEAEKGGIIGSTAGLTTSGGSNSNNYRRKSSVDNEDISQSVSDTIKRYLRMARKKSVHGDNANRFKRVNYDRNLRNIRAKGEINPPGIDEGNDKAIQTLDAWPVIAIDFIRGNESSSLLAAAHAEWQKALDERLKRKLEYDRKMQGTPNTISSGAAAISSVGTNGDKPCVSTSCSSSSAPTSPTTDQYVGSSTGGDVSTIYTHATGSSVSSLRLVGTQFFSNLWHGGNHSNTGTATVGNGHHDTGKRNAHDNEHGYNHNQHSSLLNFGRTGKNAVPTNNSSKNVNLDATMQKSKSSSNVGQFVSRKILKNRSKSQTRVNNAKTLLSKWAPSEKFTWTSENGDRIVILDTSLQSLTDIEAKTLQRIAIEKINELNIDVNFSVDYDTKSQKRRALPKKKAMTTSFFDIGKKDDQSATSSTFGNTLEFCVANDNRRRGNLKTSSERGSRNSIASLFRSSSNASDAVNKLSDNVRSYESLPSSTFSFASPMQASDTSGSDGEGGRGGKANAGGYFGKSASMLITRSQSDVRRPSQEFDLPRFEHLPVTSVLSHCDLQVPSFVTACIRYLEDNGLYKIGLFRVSTSKKRVKQIRDEFDKNALMTIAADTCPHDVATLLKEFLRDLPEPLLCSGLYKAFLETQKIRNRRLQLEAISHLVKLLPVAHRDTLYVLLKFLAKLAACSDDVTNNDGSVKVSGNKMDSNNLATVFAPNILRGTIKNTIHMTTAEAVAAARNNGTTSEQESMSDAINVIRIMIDHYEEIFKVPAELIDLVYSYMLDTYPEKLYLLCEQRGIQAREDFGTSCSSLSSPEQLISPIATTTGSSLRSAGKSPSSSANTGNDATRRLYTRESVMHDNDASRAPDAVINSSKRYSDTQPSRHSMTQKIRQDDRRANNRNLDATAVDRRQSSPNVLDKSSVVLASLQIPVPAQSHFVASTTPQLYQQASHIKESNNRSDAVDQIVNNYAYSDVPYIEDTASGRHDLDRLNECFPISASLSFPTKLDSPVKDVFQHHQQQQQQQQQRQPQQLRNDDTEEFRLRQNSSSHLTSPTSVLTCPLVSVELSEGNDGISTTMKNEQDKRKSNLNEPKLPASISNIGGAILRSKTADFERMSVRRSQAAQQRLNSAIVIGATTTSMPTTVMGAGAGSMTTTSTATTHLYKRQELIPSAKRSSNRK